MELVTLRDQLAMAALTGLLAMHADPSCGKPDAKELTGWSYDFADAMLKAR